MAPNGRQRGDTLAVARAVFARSHWRRTDADSGTVMRVLWVGRLLGCYRGGIEDGVGGGVFLISHFLFVFTRFEFSFSGICVPPGSAAGIVL